MIFTGDHLRRDHSHVARYGLIDDDPISSINAEDDHEVLTTGQSQDAYLQSYVTIPPATDVSCSYSF